MKKILTEEELKDKTERIFYNQVWTAGFACAAFLLSIGGMKQNPAVGISICMVFFLVFLIFLWLAIKSKKKLKLLSSGTTVTS
jgi:hypothetical protein